MSQYQKRRSITTLIILAIIACVVSLNISNTPEVITTTHTVQSISSETGTALIALERIEVKGRASKTDYSREQFGGGWETQAGCDTRNIILNRDLTNVVVDQSCTITQGTLNDPYTAKIITFQRGSDTSSLVQIDHVVALSNAWQTGAFQLTPVERVAFANDPLELLAVDGAANQQKSDGDAATWLPSNKAFRCQYVARQIAVKVKYRLWMTPAESDVIRGILKACPSQALPAE